jgi:hypothetical protein
MRVHDDVRTNKAAGSSPEQVAAGLPFGQLLRLALTRLISLEAYCERTVLLVDRLDRLTQVAAESLAEAQQAAAVDHKTTLAAVAKTRKTGVARSASARPKVRGRRR